MRVEPVLTGMAALALSVTATAVSASDLVKVYNRVKSSVVDIEVTQKTVNPATKVGLVSVGGNSRATREVYSHVRPPDRRVSSAFPSSPTFSIWGDAG